MTAVRFAIYLPLLFLFIAKVRVEIAPLPSHTSGFLFFALPLCLIYAALRGEGRPDV